MSAGDHFNRSWLGTPIIRSGDSVFLLNKDYSPFSFSKSDMLADLERRMLAGDNYRCPFDFVTEFAQWFEWQKRVHFDKQTTGKVTTDMVSDVVRIKAHKIQRELMFRMMTDFRPMYHPLGVCNASTS